MTISMIRDRAKKRWSHSADQPQSRQFWANLHNRLGRNHLQMGGDHNRLELSDALLLNVRFDVGGSDNRIILGKGVRLANLIIRVRGNGHQIEIGEGCSLQGGEIWIEDNGCILKIGARTTVVEAHFAVTEPGSIIEVGQECMFAHGIELRCGDSHSIVDLETGKRINYAKNIRLGRHVWVASDVMILKGVEIGDDCVVAARSLVTRSFPANSLIGGAPAAVLREGITWKRERIYEPVEERL